MSNLPADPAAAIVGGQLAIGQHLGVKEVVLRKKTPEQLSLQFVCLFLPRIFMQFQEISILVSIFSLTYYFSARDGVERRSKQLSPVNECLHYEVCHWKNRGVILTDSSATDRSWH